MGAGAIDEVDDDDDNAMDPWRGSYSSGSLFNKNYFVEKTEEKNRIKKGRREKKKSKAIKDFFGGGAASSINPQPCTSHPKNHAQTA